MAIDNNKNSTIIIYSMFFNIWTVISWQHINTSRIDATSYIILNTDIPNACRECLKVMAIVTMQTTIRTYPDKTASVLDYIINSLSSKGFDTFNLSKNNQQIKAVFLS